MRDKNYSSFSPSIRAKAACSLLDFVVKELKYTGHVLLLGEPTNDLENEALPYSKKGSTKDSPTCAVVTLLDR